MAERRHNHVGVVVVYSFVFIHFDLHCSGVANVQALSAWYSGIRFFSARSSL